MDQGERPKFRNVEPRSRQERLANNDKEMLEKLRLEHRRGGAYRYDNPGNIIQPPEDSAAFISEGERFGTNAAQEEYENRRRRILEREVRAVVNPRITNTRASTAAAARERPPSIVGRRADPTCHESRKTAPLFWVPAILPIDSAPHPSVPVAKPRLNAHSDPSPTRRSTSSVSARLTTSARPRAGMTASQ